MWIKKVEYESLKEDAGYRERYDKLVDILSNADAKTIIHHASFVVIGREAYSALMSKMAENEQKVLDFEIERDRYRAKYEELIKEKWDAYNK